MNEQRRFIRFVIEGELEIIDRTQTRVYLNDFGTDEHGNLGMVIWSEESEEVTPPEVRALTNLMSSAFSENRDRVGFKLWSASPFARLVVDGEHPAVTLPAVAARRADGTYPEEE